MRSETEIWRLRAELEEAEQSFKDELANEAQNIEAKDGGAGRAAGKTKEEGRRKTRRAVGTIVPTALYKMRVRASELQPRTEGRWQQRSGRSSTRRPRK